MKVNMIRLPFRNRNEAGRLLAEELTRRNLPSDTAILTLPRGGVPVGFAIAQALHLPLDVVVARKLGVPWQPELAMGAVAGESVALDEKLIRDLRISQAEVDAIVARERAEVKRREKLYRGARPAPDLSGRIAILVDDGLATGWTMVAAARSIRNRGPQSVRIAVPVGSEQACRLMDGECDECICLAKPRPFEAVGQWYEDFRQVSDAEVIYFLGQSQREYPAPAG
jgi:putative phosphoribosyl transferase